MIIDPYDLNGKWSEERLQAWVLFGICVANKPADPTSKKLQRFLDNINGDTPFNKVKRLVRNGTLRKKLLEFRFGQYNRIERAFREAVQLKDLMNVTVDQLEQVHGIGMKTSRMILLYYKPESDLAAFDTHVLKWMRARGYDVGESTPTGKKYLELEKAFVREAHKRGMTAKELDEKVWKMYANPQKPELVN